MAKDTTESGLAGVSRAYRTAAGLDERKSDKPTDPGEVAELHKRTEPEGGYSEGITNVSATTKSEHPGGQVTDSGDEDKEKKPAKKAAAKKDEK